MESDIDDLNQHVQEILTRFDDMKISRKEAYNNILIEQSKQKAYYDAIHTVHDFKVGEKIKGASI